MTEQFVQPGAHNQDAAAIGFLCEEGKDGVCPGSIDHIRNDKLRLGRLPLTLLRHGARVVEVTNRNKPAGLLSGTLRTLTTAEHRRTPTSAAVTCSPLLSLRP